MRSFGLFTMAFALCAFLAPAGASAAPSNTAMQAALADGLGLNTALDTARAAMIAEGAIVSGYNTTFMGYSQPHLPLADIEKLISETEDLVSLKGTLAHYCSTTLGNAMIKKLAKKRARTLASWVNILRARLAAAKRPAKPAIKSLLGQMLALKRANTADVTQRVHTACALAQAPKFQIMLANMKTTFGGSAFLPASLYAAFQKALDKFNTSTISALNSDTSKIQSAQSSLSKQNVNASTLSKARADLYDVENYLNGNTFEYVYCTAAGRSADSFMSILGSAFLPSVNTLCAQSSAIIAPTLTNVRSLLATAKVAAGI
jgi:hypothetical protein